MSHQPHVEREELALSDPAARAWQYGETLAASLIAYAARDASFAVHLRARMSPLLAAHGKRNTALPGYESPRAGDAFRLLVPPGIESAVRRLEWLAQRLEDGSLPGMDAAADVLATWLGYDALLDPRPRQIVVGVVVVAVPGITLGRFKIKRKAMTVVVRNDIALALDWGLTQQVTDASFGVMLRALDMAKGDLRKLEPEVADWLFQDRALAFYGADIPSLALIRRELRNLDVIHAAIEDRRGTAVLAVSPAADGAWQDIAWGIETIAR